MRGSESGAVVAVPEMLTQPSLLELWKVIWAVREVLKVLEFLRVLISEEVRPTHLAVAIAAGYDIRIWAGCC